MTATKSQRRRSCTADHSVKKGKGFPYSIPSVGLGADPGVQAVSPQVTVSHPPVGRLSLLSARPAVTFPAAEHHRPLAGTKLYCLVTEAHRCKQLAQGCYAASHLEQDLNSRAVDRKPKRLTRCTTAPYHLNLCRRTTYHSTSHKIPLYICDLTQQSV